jgi:hypothetical protein
MGVRGQAVAVLAVVLAGCAVPTVPLPDADPSSAPGTVAPPGETIAPGITLSPGVTVPTTEVPSTVAPSTAPTVPEPPEPDMPVDQIGAALFATVAAHGPGTQFWSVRVVPSGVELSVQAGDGAVDYRWTAEALDGPLESTVPGRGLQPFGPEEVDTAGAQRAYDFMATYVGRTTVADQVGIDTPGGFLWIVTVVRVDGPAATGVFTGAGDLRELQG